MAEPADRNGGNGFVYFVIGALVVAVAVIAWIALAGGNDGVNEADISLDAPAVEAPDVDLPDVEAPDLPEPEAPDVDVDVDRAQ